MDWMKKGFKGLEENEFASFSNVLGPGPVIYNGIVTLEKSKKANTVELDPEKLAAAMKAREETNKLLGF